MKRNKESKCRQRVMCRLNANKKQQRVIDLIHKDGRVSYSEMLKMNRGEIVYRMMICLFERESINYAKTIQNI